MHFNHSCFRTFKLEEIPLHRDLYLMDEVWMVEWEEEYIKFSNSEGSDGDPYTVGYISNVSVSMVSDTSVEICWYPNFYDRFHVIRIIMPRSAIVVIAEAWNYDNSPTVFVRSEWLRQMHLRSYSVFAIIDAVNMTKEIASGRICRSKLLELRERIDNIADHYLDISFISFADSVLLKTNWSVGMVGASVEYSYSPEKIFSIYNDLRSVYRETLNLDIYCVLAQGANEFYEDALTHRSASGNHISLNSLGLPFAQIMLIENAAREAIRAGEHSPHDIYMDKDFFYSLRFLDHNVKELVRSAPYKQKLSSGTGKYFYINYDEIEKIIKI